MEVPIIATKFRTLGRDTVRSATDFTTDTRFHLYEGDDLFKVNLIRTTQLSLRELWMIATTTLDQIPLEKAEKDTFLKRMKTDKKVTEQFVARTMPLQEHISAFYDHYKKYKKVLEEVYTQEELTPQTKIELHLGKELVATSGSELKKRKAFLQMIAQPDKVVYGEMSLNFGDLVSLMDSCRNENGQIERDAVVQLIDEKLETEEGNTLTISTKSNPIHSFTQSIEKAGFGKDLLSSSFEKVLTRMQNYLERGGKDPYSEKDDDYKKLIEFVAGLTEEAQSFLKDQYGIQLPKLGELRRGNFDDHVQKRLKEMVKGINDYRLFVVGITREVENGLDTHVAFLENWKNGKTRKCAEYLTNQVLGDLFGLDLVNKENGARIASLWKEVVRSASVLTQHCYEIAQDINTEFLEPQEVG